MMHNSFYEKQELEKLGFASLGKDVLISRKVSFYGVQNIVIGDNVRIDDFCILSGNIHIGSNIHISAYCALYGSKGIVMEDYTGLSPRCTLFSAMDDFSGNYLIGPIHPIEMTNVTGGEIIIKKYVQIGCNCVIFPNLIIDEGSVVGAMSLLVKSTEKWGVYVGIPAKKIKNRTDNLIHLFDNK